MIAALSGQRCQVAPSEMAVDVLVDAAKLLGTLQGQDPPPAGFRYSGLTREAMKQGFAEEELGVLS